MLNGSKCELKTWTSVTHYREEQSLLKITSIIVRKNAHRKICIFLSLLGTIFLYISFFNRFSPKLTFLKIFMPKMYCKILNSMQRFKDFTFFSYLKCSVNRKSWGTCLKIYTCDRKLRRLNTNCSAINITLFFSLIYLTHSFII